MIEIDNLKKELHLKNEIIKIFCDRSSSSHQSMYELNEDDTLSHRNSHSTEIEDEESPYDDSENISQINLVDSIGNQLNQIREDMHKDFLTFRSKNNHGVIEKNHSNDLKEMIGDSTPKTDKSHI